MRKLLILILAAGCIFTGRLLFLDYNRYSPDAFRDNAPVIRGSADMVISSYYDSFGPFKNEHASQREVNALARYSEAKIYYDAFAHAGESEKAGKYAKIMEETWPLVTDETKAYLEVYAFYR